MLFTFFIIYEIFINLENVNIFLGPYYSLNKVVDNDRQTRQTISQQKVEMKKQKKNKSQSELKTRNYVIFKIFFVVISLFPYLC